MKLAMLAACASVAAALCAAMSPAAAAPAPAGSYGATCRDVRFDGRTLVATCETRRQTPFTSALNTEECSRPVVVNNDNGRLTCRSRSGAPLYGQEVRSRPSYGDNDYRPGPRPDADRREMPRGSWQRSCEVESFEYGVLRASCRDRSGFRNRTRIDVRRCGPYPRLANDDGNLVCER